MLLTALPTKPHYMFGSNRTKGEVMRMPARSVKAWNNFVIRSNPVCYEQGSNMRHAAIANMFMGGANNGGLNSFLTSSYALEAREVQRALTAVGAHKAARQLQTVVDGLNTALPASSQEERWRRLDEHWRDEWMSLASYPTKQMTNWWPHLRDTLRRTRLSMRSSNRTSAISAPGSSRRASSS